MSEVKQVVSSPVVSGVSRVVARSPVSPFLLVVVVVVVVLLLPSLSYYYYSPLSLILFSLSLYSLTLPLPILSIQIRSPYKKYYISESVSFLINIPPSEHLLNNTNPIIYFYLHLFVLISERLFAIVICLIFPTMTARCYCCAPATATT